MSEHITHVAVYDDTVKLIHHSDRFTEAFRLSTEKEFDSGFVASGTNGNHIWAVPLLEEYRGKYKAGDRSDECLKKIAAAIGWITHRAADLVVKPTLAVIRAENNPAFNDQEQSPYYDSIAFHEVFEGGKRTITPYEPFSSATLDDDMKSHPVASFLNTHDFEVPITHFYLSEMLKNHEFTEKTLDFESWFDLFMDSKQKFSENLNYYIESFQRPDPAKTTKFVDTFNYYNPKDQIIHLARSIQKGSPDESISVHVAVDAANCQSHYAKMLRNAYTMLSYASDFFDGKIGKDPLYDVLNMHGSERR